MRTTSFTGAVNKGVTVYSNDPNNARALLRLKGTILVPIEVRPKDRVLITGKLGAIRPQELVLFSRNGEPFDILEVKKRSEHIEIALEPAPESAKARADGSKAPPREPPEGAVAGGHAAYKATLTVSDEAPIGRLFDLVTLATNHPKHPRVQIRINGRVDGDLIVSPQALQFQRPKPGEPAPKREVRLSRRPKGGLEILGVESTSPAFVPTVRMVAEGLEYLVDVERPAGKAHRGGRATLRIRTNVGVVEIPISAR